MISAYLSSERPLLGFNVLLSRVYARHSNTKCCGVSFGALQAEYKLGASRDFEPV